ncbi:MAG: TaqI family restriction endonuclease [Patescibacteria group bacterium]
MHTEKDTVRFTKFLAEVPLAVYRARYAPVKIVEMDLSKDIHALDLLYEIYWAQKEFIPFETFYDRYSHKYSKHLEKFRKKIGMCKKCFYKGLPARIYRTWASIITQIHGGYMAGEVFGYENIAMSGDLDHKGADFRILYDTPINVQVKKETKSREVRIEKTFQKKLDGVFVTIRYFVPQLKVIQEPKKRNGNLKKAYYEFHKQYLEPRYLSVLPNGFVIFQLPTQVYSNLNPR